MTSPTCTYGLGAAAAFLALASNVNVSAFAPAATAPTLTRSRGIIGNQATKLPPLSVVSQEHASPDYRSSCGMSKADIQRLFEDVDRDGNGSIDFEELDYLLTEYFPG